MTDGSLILHYYSDRPGLEHIVIGIVKVSSIFVRESLYRLTLRPSPFRTWQAVASKLHGVEVEVELIRRKGDVIELTETDTRRLERTGTTTCKSNRPSTSDQVPVDEQAAGATAAKASNNSKCDGNWINIYLQFIVGVN